MKTFLKGKFIFVALLFLFWGIPDVHSQAFQSDDPGLYSNYIVNEQSKVGNEFIEFSNLLVNSREREAKEAKRLEVTRAIDLSLRRLRNMGDFKGSDVFKNQSIEVFLLYKELYTKEYAQIVLHVSSEGGTIEELEAYFALQTLAEEKTRNYTAKMRLAQDKFAIGNGAVIVDNPMQGQFDQILESSIYGRKVFLEYIRVAKLNELWWDAMEEKDGEGMQSAVTEIISAVKGSVLKNTAGIFGNSDFRDVAWEWVVYYDELAKGKYVELQKYFVEGFKTQGDVDNFNEFVKEYNLVDSNFNQKFNISNQEMKNRALSVAE